VDIDRTDNFTMTAERALIDLLRKIFQSLGVHFFAAEEELPKPGLTERPILGGLQSIKGGDPLVVRHGKDRALLDTLAATGTSIDLNHLFEGEF
jgi:hypothetical protein